jgi:hypothetical protein
MDFRLKQRRCLGRGRRKNLDINGLIGLLFLQRRWSSPLTAVEADDSCFGNLPDRRDKMRLLRGRPEGVFLSPLVFGAVLRRRKELGSWEISILPS